MMERSLTWVAAGLLAIVMVVGAVDVVAGEVFGAFLAFKVDMSGTLCAAAIFLAWPLVERRDEHIAVDLFDPITPAWLRGLRAWLALGAALVVFGLIARGMWGIALSSLAIRETSAATLGYPIWPAKIACALGASVVLVTLLFKAVARLRRGEGAA
ncbi:TRAP transporter small permease [Gemmobacter nectariphilus]|uniref:TRAP transporter small permease n=1 Tax=Gemmobacter nectariphilus TaxID=220343 RepID=UPI0004846D50|nr:TRAP transporter small permease subunit [Gemmobacter nectariphilus]